MLNFFGKVFAISSGKDRMPPTLSDLLRNGKFFVSRLFSAVQTFVTAAFLTIFVPWRSTYEPIHSLLNASDDQRDKLTGAWRDRKLAELAFVGVTVGFKMKYSAQFIHF